MPIFFVLAKCLENLDIAGGYLEIIAHIASERIFTSSVWLAVNTHTELAIVPLQGCEAILIEILQPQRSAAGLHF